MEEITLQVSRCEESGWLVASWNDSTGQGGITTQARDLGELQEQVVEATQCHFEPGTTPGRIRLHFVTDAFLVPA
jgi:hypothetical protein